LLPSSVKDAAKFKAASACLDKLFDSFDERVKMMLVYSRIDELDNEPLDELAWQWNVGYYEGYSFAKTLDDKRVLIKHAILLHWHKGTKWSLESIPIFLGMPAFTIEWFEADLIGAQMNPYEFDIAIDTSVRGVSPTIYDDIHNLINNLKNVRSYLRHIILMASWSVTAYYGAMAIGSSVVSVRPKDWTGGTTKIKYGRAIGEYSAVVGHVRPKIWTEKNIKIKYRKGIGCYAATIGKVNPAAWNGGQTNVKIKNRIGVYFATIGRVNPAI
jgi:P2-related tail formation protein